MLYNNNNQIILIIIIINALQDKSNIDKEGIKVQAKN